MKVINKIKSSVSTTALVLLSTWCHMTKVITQQTVNQLPTT